MGLSSSVNFRSSQVDPGSMLAPAAPATSGAGNAGAFQRHLADARRNTESPADRASAARDDQRQRSDASRSAKKSDDTSSASTNDTKSDTTFADGAPLAAMAQAPAPEPAPQADETETGTATLDPAGEKNAAPMLAAPPKDAAGDGATTPLDAKAAASQTAGTTPAQPAGNEMNTGSAEAVGKTGFALPLEAAHAADTPAADAQKPAGAPMPASQAQIAAIAAAPAPQMSGPAEDGQDGEAADPEASLTIKPKEGLGHSAASQMADKAAAKEATGAAAPNAQPAQTATAQTAAAQTAPFMAPNSAAARSMPAGAPGSLAISATAPATGTSDAALATHLNDLQAAGSGNASANANTATVRIGTLPGQTQPTQLPAMAIALQMARNLQKGTNRFDIRLDPPEMGRIDVRMEVHRDGTVSAHLTVEKAQTLDLLQRDARALQQALNDAGLQANADSLNFSLHDEKAGGGAPEFSGGPQTSPAAGTAAADEPALSPIYNVNLSATGGVDIRV